MLRLCLLPLLLAGSTALASGAHGHELDVSVGRVSYGGFFRPSGDTVHWFELGYHRGLGGAEGPFRVGGGLRTGLPNQSPVPTLSLPLEAYVDAQLRVRIGFWEPLVGPELGFSGLTDLGWHRAGLPTDIFVLEQQRVGLFYVAFHAAPLRFRWRNFTASVVDVSVGTTLGPPGASSRVKIGYLSVGVDL